VAPVALGSGGYFSVISLVVSIFIYIFATKSIKENEYEEVITTSSPDGQPTVMGRQCK
jgi:hypothetical protein